MIPTKKLRKAMHEIVAKKGEFIFFGHILRDDSPFARWDLVVSAPWLEVGELESIGEIQDLLTASLGKAAMREIAQVKILSPDDRNLRTFISEYPVEDGELRLRGGYLFDVEITESVILQSRRPPRARRKVRAKPSRRGARAA